jgi:sulfite reductase beta subunit-like hemoprotein
MASCPSIESLHALSHSMARLAIPTCGFAVVEAERVPRALIRRAVSAHLDGCRLG